MSRSAATSAAVSAAPPPASAAAAAPLIQAQGLRKAFTLPAERLFAERRRVIAVDDVSFAVPAGSTFGLVGESGSGKSTVAKMLLKLEAPTAGTLLYGGADVFGQSGRDEKAYRRAVQAVLQDPYGALSPRMKVRTIVAEPLRAQGVSKAEAAATAERMLEVVGLDRAAADKYPHQFSGGQRQRIAIARALSVEPKVLILDEPVSALDVSIRAQILQFLKAMQERMGVTFIFIGHDLATVQYMSDEVAVMYFGRIVEIGPAARLLQVPRHPYTQKLVAVAAHDRPLDAQGLVGEMPNPLSPPSGCSFRTRCPYAEARCAAEVPPLAAADAESSVACHFWPEIMAGRKAVTGPLLA